MTKNRKTQQFLKNNISGETFYEKWPILSRSNVICNLKFAIDSNKLHVLLIMLYFLLIPSFLYHCVTTFYHTWHHKRLSVNLILNLKSAGKHCNIILTPIWQNYTLHVRLRSVHFLKMDGL